MIDNQDKQTQPLPLDEQPAKRGRGRPGTGKALSNAERQRLYRERQKAQRNEKQESHAVPYEEVVAIAQELGERCKKAEERIKELEKELAQRNEKPVRTRRHRDEPAAELAELDDRTYTLQARSGSGNWVNLVVGLYGTEASRQLDRVIDSKISGGSKNRQYRLVED